MFFRASNLKQKKNHAGFKKCWATTVSSRDMAPFGSAFPPEAHGEVEVIVVCSMLSPKPNEEEMDGVAGAYVNNGIILHMAKEGAFDKDKVAEVLSEYKIKIVDSTPIEGDLF